MYSSVLSDHRYAGYLIVSKDVPVSVSSLQALVVLIPSALGEGNSFTFFIGAARPRDILSLCGHTAECYQLGEPGLPEPDNPKRLI